MRQKRASRDGKKELTLSCSVPKMDAKKFAIVMCDVPVELCARNRVERRANVCFMDREIEKCCCAFEATYYQKKTALVMTKVEGCRTPQTTPQSPSTKLMARAMSRVVATMYVLCTSSLQVQARAGRAVVNKLNVQSKEVGGSLNNNDIAPNYHFALRPFVSRCSYCRDIISTTF